MTKLYKEANSMTDETDKYEERTQFVIGTNDSLQQLIGDNEKVHKLKTY